MSQSFGNLNLLSSNMERRLIQLEHQRNFLSSQNRNISYRLNHIVQRNINSQIEVIKRDLIESFRFFYPRLNRLNINQVTISETLMIRNSITLAEDVLRQISNISNDLFDLL